MRFGLKEQQVQAIMAILKSYPEVEEVILSGSGAKGNFKPASNIDQTFNGDALNSTILNKIAWDLDDLLLPFTFDLSLFWHIK